MKYILKILAMAYFAFIVVLSGYGLRVCIAKVLYETIGILLKILLTLAGISLFIMILTCIALIIALIFGIVDDIKTDVMIAKRK